MSDGIQNLKDRINALPSINALVVGDLILDRYVWGSVDRISPEAPIQILDVDQEEKRLGGAANVCQNLISLDNDVRVLSWVGDDSPGDTMRGMMEELGVQTEHLHHTEDRKTPLKSRMIAHGQQVLRMDQEDTFELNPDQKERLVSDLESQLDWADVVFLVDYRKGILTPDVLSRIFTLCRGRDIPTFVDPKGSDYDRYEGTFAITPNKEETEQATGIQLDNQHSYRKAAKKLNSQLQSEFVIITRGSEGMSLFKNEDLELHIPAEEIEVFDVTGAGDTVVAVLGWMFGAGASPLLSVQVANIAGARAVASLGTTVISRSDLYQLEDHSDPTSEKITTPDKIGALLEDDRREGNTIVFTNGCFDLLHRGHVQTLRFSADQGSVLVVGMNADESVKQIKGDQRPVKDEEDRARLLASFEMVDYVVPFSSETPRELIRSVRPDVLVKGEDWKGKEVVGQDIVESSGGRVAFAPLIDGYSTTDLIKKIQEGT